MATSIQFECVQAETVPAPSDDAVSLPAAKTFLGIAYMATSSKPTTSRIKHFMRNTEQAFEDLLRRH